MKAVSNYKSQLFNDLIVILEICVFLLQNGSRRFWVGVWNVKFAAYRGKRESGRTVCQAIFGRA